MEQVKTYPLKQLDPKSLLKNDFNPNHVDPVNLDKLKQSVERLGFFNAVKVRELPDGTQEIVGGEHRAQVAVALGMTEIPCMMLGRIDEATAKAIMLADNARYGQEDHAELLQVLSDIGSADDIMSWYPIDESEKDSYFLHDTDTDTELAELDDLADDEEVDLSSALTRNTKTHKILRFKVSLEDADAITDLILQTQKDQGFNEADQLTNSGDALAWLLNQMKS